MSTPHVRLWPVIPFCFALALGSRGVAQEPSQDAVPAPVVKADEKDSTQTEMSEMASSMKSMADMCRTMMEREMQSRPYLLAAGAVLGGLIVVALVLFIVLEVQWIRLLGVRIKTERQKAP